MNHNMDGCILIGIRQNMFGMQLEKDCKTIHNQERQRYIIDLTKTVEISIMYICYIRIL